MTSDTLRIRNLPPKLTISENVDLIKHFGAVQVDCIGTKNVTAFAKFASTKAATVALGRLHQLDVLGYLLKVNYAPPSQEPSSTPEHAEKKTEGCEGGTRYETFLRKLNAWSLGLDFTQPPPAHLRYQYPPPSMQVLANIARALCAVPRLYTQVLHLMNRMNLPSPFHETCQEHQAALDALLGPRPVRDLPPMAAPQEEVAMKTSSSESEMESDGETPRDKSPPRLPAKRARKSLKRTKLIITTQGVKSTPTVPVTDVFEIPPAVSQSQHKIELRLTSTPAAPSLNETPPFDSSGFGVLFPPIPETPETEQPSQDVSESDGTTITVTQLRANRLPDRDRSMLPVFKGYQAGAPSCRLYVKNITKSVTSRDLHFIFRAFLTPEDDQDKFDIRYMTEGRMRGQAFVTYPSVPQAQSALLETNGYLLQDKPLVVQFARSAKPKTEAS